MTQTENTTESLKGKHLTYKEQVKIEALRSLDTPVSGNKIAEYLGCARQTIHMEIKDGTIRQIRNKSKMERFMSTNSTSTQLMLDKPPMTKHG
ncbi:helix-turn-helix domain-containing protein [Enterococcus avium]